MTMLDKCARAVHKETCSHCDGPVDQDYAIARAVLEALRDPPEEMWGGLPRAIMMWLDMGDKTPRALFKHLERSGHEIPQWLRDEPEMKSLDHVPSKGTRVVILFRAMIDEALKERT